MNEELEFDDNGDPVEKYKFYLSLVSNRNGKIVYDYKVITSPFEYPLESDLLKISQWDGVVMQIIRVV